MPKYTLPFTVGEFLCLKMIHNTVFVCVCVCIYIYMGVSNCVCFRNISSEVT